MKIGKLCDWHEGTDLSRCSNTLGRSKLNFIFPDYSHCYRRATQKYDCSDCATYENGNACLIPTFKGKYLSHVSLKECVDLKTICRNSIACVLNVLTVLLTTGAEKAIVLADRIVYPEICLLRKLDLTQAIRIS